MNLPKSAMHTPLTHLPKCILFAPQNFAQALFSISLGTAVIPRRNEKKCYAKFWEANKMHYGRCASGICAKLLFCSSNLLKLSLPLSLPLSLHKVITCTFKQQMLFFFSKLKSAPRQLK